MKTAMTALAAIGGFERCGAAIEDGNNVDAIIAAGGRAAGDQRGEEGDGSVAGGALVVKQEMTGELGADGLIRGPAGGVQVIAKEGGFGGDGASFGAQKGGVRGVGIGGGAMVKLKEARLRRRGGMRRKAPPGERLGRRGKRERVRRRREEGRKGEQGLFCSSRGTFDSNVAGHGNSKTGSHEGCPLEDYS